MSNFAFGMSYLGFQKMMIIEIGIFIEDQMGENFRNIMLDSLIVVEVFVRFVNIQLISKLWFF